jgi:hypothetical protein
MNQFGSSEMKLAGEIGMLHNRQRFIIKVPYVDSAVTWLYTCLEMGK